MNDELKRIKYRYLLNNVYQIRNKLKKLELDSLDLYNYTNSNVKIDGICISKESFDSIKESFTEIKSELRNKLIYSITKKI